MIINLKTEKKLFLDIYRPPIIGGFLILLFALLPAPILFILNGIFELIETEAIEKINALVTGVWNIILTFGYKIRIGIFFILIWFQFYLILHYMLIYFFFSDIVSYFLRWLRIEKSLMKSVNSRIVGNCDSWDTTAIFMSLTMINTLVRRGEPYSKISNQTCVCVKKRFFFVDWKRGNFDSEH